MKPDGAPGVRHWLDEQIAETLYLTSISLSELLLGVELLPGGKRKAGLSTALGEPTPDAALHALYDRLLAHTGGPPTDDLALVLCQPTGGPAPVRV